MIDPDELAKLQTLHALLGKLNADDAFLTEHIKNAINFSLTGSIDTPAPLESFSQAVRKLSDHLNVDENQRFNFYHLDLRKDYYDPLWIRKNVITALKTLAGYKTASLLITGLRSSICPSGKYWTSKLRDQHQQAISYIDELAQQWTTPSTILNIVYVS